MFEAGVAAQSALCQIRSTRRQLDFRLSTLVIMLVAAAVSAVLLTTLVTLWFRDIGLLAGGWDFCIYRDGGRHVLEDLPLYAKATGRCKFEYIYPPFAALTFVPLVWLPDGADKYIWFAINMAVLIASVMLCFRNSATASPRISSASRRCSGSRARFWSRFAPRCSSGRSICC